jgi:hypothetical protein
VWRWEPPTSPLTLWGWVAEVADWAALRPDPKEVAEVMWMEAGEVPGHPDALPTNESFCACLLERCGPGGAAV